MKWLSERLAALGRMLMPVWVGRNTIHDVVMDPDALDAFRRSIAIATQRGHPTTNDVHLALALLEEPTVAAFVEKLGGQTPIVRSALDAYLAKIPNQKAGCDVEPGAEVLDCASAAIGRRFGAGQLSVSAVDLFLTDFCYLELPSSIIMREAGLPAALALYLRAHGTLEDPSPSFEGNDDAPALVILHNDEFTTMAMVIRILTDQLGYDSHAANSIMRKVHENGRAAVGTFPGDIAVRYARAARQAARDAGMPLKVTIEPVE